MIISVLEQRLLNDYQRCFPMKPAPFAAIAAQLDTDSQTVIKTLVALSERGAISRVGPVFRPNAVGVSTLAAMSVPSKQLVDVAAVVSGYSQVNHNYEREHSFNLWFVVTAVNSVALEQTLKDIQLDTGYVSISLPLVNDYHIDLGFGMKLDQELQIRDDNCLDENEYLVPVRERSTEAEFLDEHLIEAIQFGLPLVEKPFLEIARMIGAGEQAVIKRIRALQDAGSIRRFGVVVRHHELGYRDNAMAAWDVPDAEVDALGEKIGLLDCVTLCYRRRRHLPEWRYNLFCMIHGRERGEVLRSIEEIVESFNLGALPHQVLFSRRRFKQRGACYINGAPGG